jgi:hypothetical protein
MSTDRRTFLSKSSLALLAAAAAPTLPAQTPQPNQDPTPQDPTKGTPGAPPAYGTGPAVGPEVSTTTFTEAEKLVQIELAPKDLSQAAATWRTNLAALYERRTGPRKVAIDYPVAPFSHYSSVLHGQSDGPQKDRFVRATANPGPLPTKDEDIAYSSVSQLSRWI